MLNAKAERILKECEDTGEPVFIFRAKDFFAPQVIVHYVELVEKFGPTDLDFQAQIVDRLQEIKDWQRENMGQVKYPD